MKFKLSTLFTAAAILLACIMCAAVGYNYGALQSCNACSAPAWVAFYLAIPYTAAIAVCLLVAHLLRRRGK